MCIFKKSVQFFLRAAMWFWCAAPNNLHLFALCLVLHSFCESDLGFLWRKLYLKLRMRWDIKFIPSIRGIQQPDVPLSPGTSSKHIYSMDFSFRVWTKMQPDEKSPKTQPCADAHVAGCGQCWRSSCSSLEGNLKSLLSFPSPSMEWCWFWDMTTVLGHWVHLKTLSQ